jgi:hypothetical protein
MRRWFVPVPRNRLGCQLRVRKQCRPRRSHIELPAQLAWRIAIRRRQSDLPRFIMFKQWVSRLAVVSALAVSFDQPAVQAQPAPAFIPPPAPAPPVTLFRFLGIPQGFQRIADARLNRNGNFPGLERKPPLKPIAHPDNLFSKNPAIKKAAEIKMEEDLAKQKIKAIKYLAKMGCDKCYGGVKEALMAALDDCTEQVRYEAAKGIAEAAAQHCDMCSRQCCCDEELTKKLAQIVYEMDDKCCPLEPSERVREMAREALTVCCPNVGPPGEVIETPEVPEVPPEVPPETPPETPPEVPPELPPPPGQNGVTPRTTGTVPSAPGRNGIVPLPNGGRTSLLDEPMPLPRPKASPEASLNRLLRSRADRMAGTAHVRRAPVVNQQKRVAPRQVQAVAAQQPVVAPLPPIETKPADPPPVARIVISDDAVIGGKPSANSQGFGVQGHNAGAGMPAISNPSADALRVRISDNSDAAAQLPRPTPMRSASVGGNSVRIRDNEASDLQLASAETVITHGAALAHPASSRRSIGQAAIVSDLFAPAAQTSARAHALRQPGETLASVASARPQGSLSKANGQVRSVDSRSKTLQFSFKPDKAPTVGASVKVYHKYLLGEECLGDVQVTSVKQGVATAKAIGNVNLSKVSPDDQVTFQSAGPAVVAPSETMVATHPAMATATDTVRR